MFSGVLTTDQANFSIKLAAGCNQRKVHVILKNLEMALALVLRSLCIRTASHIIRKTCPYNIYLLKPHFYIEKLGFAVVYLIFLFLIRFELKY